MNVRPMARADLDQVVDIARVAFDPPWTREQLAVELERPFAHCAVVEEGGVVLAYAIAWLLAGELEILAIATHPSRRRSGHARALVRGIFDAARSGHAARGFLEVRADNEAAIALYASMGFRRDGLRARYYADGTDAVIMVWQAAT